MIAFFIFLQVKNRNEHRVQRDWQHAWPWIVTHTLTGPTVGVSCYQWALATTPSGIVLPIIATTPLLVIPFAYFIEHDRPHVRALIGGAIGILPEAFCAPAARPAESDPATASAAQITTVRLLPLTT